MACLQSRQPANRMRGRVGRTLGTPVRETDRAARSAGNGSNPYRPDDPPEMGGSSSQLRICTRATKRIESAPAAQPNACGQRPGCTHARHGVSARTTPGPFGAFFTRQRPAPFPRSAGAVSPPHDIPPSADHVRAHKRRMTLASVGSTVTRASSHSRIVNAEDRLCRYPCVMPASDAPSSGWRRSIRRSDA